MDVSSIPETIVCSASDPRYPKRLADLPRPPIQLWVTGRLPTNEERTVAIVGSRGATAAGYEQAQEIAATVAEHGLYDLHAPIKRVTGYDTIIPLSRLEYDYIPSVARIADAARATLAE